MAFDRTAMASSERYSVLQKSHYTSSSAEKRPNVRANRTPTLAAVGLSTVDRMSRMYGTVIRVPSTVPVDIWSSDYRTGIRLVVNRILPYFDGRHTALNT